MAPGPYFIGIDAGQTVVKAVVHDANLKPLCVARGASPLQKPQARFVERSHDDLWAAATTAIRTAVESSGINPSDVAGVGITGHGDGLHLVDSDGNGVGPAITAVDSRAWREMDEILSDADRSDTILTMSGQVPFLGSPGVILAWTAKNEPERISSSHAILACKDVLRLRLTGHFGTDFSDASGTFLDHRSKTWSAELLDAYGVSHALHLLPGLHLGSDVVASVSAEAAQATGLAAGTPVVAGSHDVHAAALGMGALRDSMLTLIAGSFSINAVTTTAQAVHPSWQNRWSVTPDLRMAMSTSATASTTLEWFLGTVGASGAIERDNLFQQAANLDLSDDLPLLIPYLYASPHGEAPSGTFLGLRSWHTPAHLLKATLEGIAWMHVWHTRELSRSFSWHRQARLGGGIANSPFYSDMVAQALGLDIEVVLNEESGCFGAAAMAAVGVGHLTSVDHALDMVSVERRHSPRAADVDYWTSRTELFDSAVERLMPVWKTWNQGS